MARLDGKVRSARCRPSQNTKSLISRVVEIKSDKVDVARFLISSGLYSHARVGQNGGAAKSNSPAIKKNARLIPGWPLATGSSLRHQWNIGLRMGCGYLKPALGRVHRIWGVCFKNRPLSGNFYTGAWRPEAIGSQKERAETNNTDLSSGETPRGPAGEEDKADIVTGKGSICRRCLQDPVRPSG